MTRVTKYGEMLCTYVYSICTYYVGASTHIHTMEQVYIERRFARTKLYFCDVLVYDDVDVLS